ncbi:MAG: hypothetical protein GY851_13655 [bacterium]|nr:hypothetical protein [bacterium]
MPRAQCIVVFGITLVGLLPGAFIGMRLIANKLTTGSGDPPDELSFSLEPVDTESMDPVDLWDRAVGDGYHPVSWTKPDAAWVLVFLIGAMAVLIAMWRMIPSVESAVLTEELARGGRAEVLEVLPESFPSEEEAEVLLLCPGEDVTLSYDTHRVHVELIGNHDHHDALLDEFETSLGSDVMCQSEQAEHPDVRFRNYFFPDVETSPTQRFVRDFVARADVPESATWILVRQRTIAGRAAVARLSEGT